MYSFIYGTYKHGLICCPCIWWTEDSKQFPFATTNKIGSLALQKRNTFCLKLETPMGRNGCFQVDDDSLNLFYMGKWVVKSPTLHPLTTGRLALEFQVLKHLVLSMEEIRLTTWHVWNPVNHGIFPTNTQLVNRRISAPSAVWHTSPIWRPPKWAKLTKEWVGHQDIANARRGWRCHQDDLGSRK